MADPSDQPFKEWIGRKSESEDVVTERLVASFRATFEPHLAAVGDGLAPLGIHWCLSPAIAPMAELGSDGHPAKNRDLPPVPQPRRMWAGGSIETFGALRIEERVTRVSAIADIVRKQGRSGELWFVSMNHDYVTPRGVAIRERHDIVYREAARPASAGTGVQAREGDPSPRPTAARIWEVETPPTFLFRYSAITFNGHRIHYDLPYATQVEGYAGLVVHGPIQTTLLYNLASVQLGSCPGKFDYRGVAPAIAGDKLLICAGGAGETDSYWTQGPSGATFMEARVLAS